MLVDGRSVASIRRYNRSRGQRKLQELVMSRCKSCIDVLCCKVFAIPLTLEESRRFRKDREALIQGVKVLALKKNGRECYYLSKTGKCRVWKRRPQACREYVCQGERRRLVKLRDGM